jgi:hypothetical protein
MQSPPAAEHAEGNTADDADGKNGQDEFQG